MARRHTAHPAAMKDPSPETPASDGNSLQALRPQLLRVAYRMLGSMAEAEDIVQDAVLRYLDIDPAAVMQPAALLRTMVTRRCLDSLKSARRQRETYIGPWLPDPDIAVDPSEADDDITLPLMLALERLSPLERAAFLLHDVFGIDFHEISRMLDRSEGSCRQLASRARQNVRSARPRFPLAADQGRQIAAAFYEASRSGDLSRLRTLLAADVTAMADGGGKVLASLQPIVGAEAVMALHATLARGFAEHPSQLLGYCRVNGLPGFCTLEHGDIRQTTALQLEGEQICGIYVTRNPDKLRHLRFPLREASRGFHDAGPTTH